MLAVPCSREPVGTSMVTSIDGSPLNGVYIFHPLGSFTVRWPAAKSTSVSWAARTSSFLAASEGRTSTTVSVRSEAMILTSPTNTSTVMATGCGVSNLGMTISLCDFMTV